MLCRTLGPMLYRDYFKRQFASQKEDGTLGKAISFLSSSALVVKSDCQQVNCPYTPQGCAHSVHAHELHYYQYTPVIHL